MPGTTQKRRPTQPKSKFKKKHRETKKVKQPPLWQQIINNTRRRQERRNRYRMPKGYIAPSVVTHLITKTPIRKALKFMEYIQQQRVYLISAHACICDTGPLCYERTKMHKITFKLPANVFMLSFAQAGDYTSIIDEIVAENVDNLRNFLYMHGTNDLDYDGTVGNEKTSLFEGIRRATGEGTEYPDILYSLNTDKGTDQFDRSQNPYGVYDITDPHTTTVFNNINSILPHEPGVLGPDGKYVGARKNWTLNDIINEVNAYNTRRGLPTGGIFINSGCLSVCGKSHDMRIKVITETDTALNMAHNLYNTIVPTMTRDEVDTYNASHPNTINIPFGVGLAYPPATWDPAMIQDYIDAGLYERIEHFARQLHSDNLKEAGVVYGSAVNLANPLEEEPGNHGYRGVLNLSTP